MASIVRNEMFTSSLCDSSEELFIFTIFYSRFAGKTQQINFTCTFTQPTIEKIVFFYIVLLIDLVLYCLKFTELILAGSSVELHNFAMSS